MTDENLSRLYAIVEGRVHGVGFRYFVQDNAMALGLNGYVRNRWDETVEVLAEGDHSSLQKLLDALYRGPRAAFVTKVTYEWQPATGEFKYFSVRSTDY